MARWTFLLIDEDGDVTGTDNEETKDYYAEGGWTVIDMRTQTFALGQDDPQAIERADDPDSEDDDPEDED